MKALLYKEFRLALSPVLLVFTALSALLLIPNYMGMVGIGFVFQGIYLYFSLARGTRDDEFTLILPVSRTKIAQAKITVTVLLELLQLAAAAVFALIADFVLWREGNPVFIDPNFAFFGIALLGFSVFHLVFFPWVFGRITRPGIPLTAGLLSFCGVYLLFELLANTIPAFGQAIDTLAPASVGWRLLLFAAGIAAFAASLLAVRGPSAKKFEGASL